MKNKIKIFIASIMPGIFIIGYNVGTGSVTSMSKAGANFGFDLLWTLLRMWIFTAVFQKQIIDVQYFMRWKT